MRRWAWVLGLLCWVLTGCAEDEKLTALVVAVNSDITDLDSVTLDVERFGEQELAGTELPNGSDDLPRTLGLVHRGGPMGPITITATGLRGGQVTVVKRQARVFFVRDQVKLLRLNLLAACVDFPCGGDTTCDVVDGAPTCRSIDVVASELEDWTGDLPAMQLPMVDAPDGDAGMDAGAGDGGGGAGGGDGGPDGMVDGMVDDVDDDSGVDEMPLMCVDDTADCDGDGLDCETSLLDSMMHCGACDAVCPAAGDDHTVASSCSAGDCVVTCDGTDFDDCNDDGFDGCETSLQDSMMHCGACDAVCPAAGDDHTVTSSCSAGDCVVTCDGTDFDDCNDDGFDGCETSLQDSEQHCGACDAPCPTPGNQNVATSQCVGGGCQITCDAEWANFDTMLGNGCETPDPIFDVAPSNFDPTVAELSLDNRAAPTIDCAVTFDSGTSGAVAQQDWCGTPVTPLATTQIGGGDESVVIIPLSSLDVAAAGSLTLTGERPVILAVYGDATVAGTIDASAVGGMSGAGGGVGCASSSGSAGNGDSSSGGGGGGGGGFATAGGGGGDGGDTSFGSDVVGGNGGDARGSAELTPLIAGCPGGPGGGDPGGVGGGGGGAVQLSVTGALTLESTARVAAAGGGGQPSTGQEDGGGGGGSGGAILLEAETVTAQSGAWVTANGGSGAEGNETNSTNGEPGADGGTDSATPAPGGAGGEADGGDGGDGGAGATAPTDGGDGETSCGCVCGGFGCSADNNDNGGGGGGGSVGRIRIVGTASCALTDLSTSPDATISCP